MNKKLYKSVTYQSVAQKSMTRGACWIWPKLITLMVTSASLSAAPAEINLSDLNGSNGFRIIGVAAGAMAGSAVAGVGDINGDAIPDFAIGAPGTNFGASAEQGQIYVFFGRPAGNPWPASVDPTTLNGSNGFVINGVDAGDQLGAAIARAIGDVNGDGRRDLLIGAPKAGAAIPAVPAINYGHGEAYVLFGRVVWPAVVQLSQPFAANEGFRMNSNGPSFFGAGLSGVGDFNGDGRDDFTACADGRDGNSTGLSQRCYVVFGRASTIAWPPLMNLALVPNTEAVTIASAIASSQVTQMIGYSVAGVGDVNADGRPDVLIGGPRRRQVDTQLGGAYLAFGTSATSINPQGFSTPNDNCAAGEAVAGLGDFNGDGRADFIIGRPAVTAPAGTFNLCAILLTPNQSRIYFGSATPGAAFTNVAITHPNGTFQARALAQLGDVNGDGLADVAIGDPNVSPYTNSTNFLPGEVFILMGASTLPSDINLTANQGLLVARVKGVNVGDLTGSALAGVGDINGDGRRDLLIGAPGAAVTSAGSGVNAGGAYMLFGAANLGVSGPPSGVNTTLALTAAPGFLGQGITARARVSVPGSVAGDPRATGVVSISDENGVSCTGPLIVAAAFSEMQCVIATAQVGPHTLTANYAGAPGFGPSTASVNTTLSVAQSVLSIESHTPQPSAVGESITVRVSVSVPASSYSGPILIGFSDSAETCTINWPNSSSCALASTLAGTRSLTAITPASSLLLAASVAVDHVVTGNSANLIFANGLE